MIIKLSEVLKKETPLYNVMLGLGTKVISEIVNQKKDTPPTEFDLDIEFKINGIDCDPTLYYKRLDSAFEECVQNAARTLLEEKLSDKVENVQDKLSEINEEINNWILNISKNILGESK